MDMGPAIHSTPLTLLVRMHPETPPHLTAALWQHLEAHAPHHWVLLHPPEQPPSAAPSRARLLAVDPTRPLDDPLLAMLPPQVLLLDGNSLPLGNLLTFWNTPGDCHAPLAAWDAMGNPLGLLRLHPRHLATDSLEHLLDPRTPLPRAILPGGSISANPYHAPSWENTLARWLSRPIAFLDRDGVINEDRDFVHTMDQMVWIPHAPAAIRMLNDAGFRVEVVTNQSGIARGYYSEAVFHTFMEHMRQALHPHGARLDGIQYCPHHPQEGQGTYRRDCTCRKPRPGMLLQSLALYGADPAACLLIGDRASDLQAARDAGVPGYRYPGGISLVDFVRQCLDART
ncbi:MAG: HAD family hydrolase [Magnetococcus sp. WYHC-3]